MVKRKKIVISFILFLILLLALCFIRYQLLGNNSTASFVQHHKYKSTASDIHLYGDDKSIVVIGNRTGNKIGVSRDYVITEEIDYDEYVPSTADIILKGNVRVYDLRTSGFKSKQINILKYLQDNRPNGRLYDLSDAIFYNNRDYIRFIAYDLNNQRNSSDEIHYLFDIEEEILVEKKIDSNYGIDSNFGYVKTNLYEKFLEKGISLTDNQLLITDRKKFFLSTNENFFKEFPELIQMIQLGKADRIYFRPGLVTNESLFQTLRHWFAPLGQDRLEVVSDDGSTSFESYDQYINWFDSHKKK